MSFRRWRLDFDGAYADPASLQEQPGVYVVWCRGSEQWRVVDIGESGNVRERLLQHERADCWRKYCSRSSLRFAAAYLPSVTEQERRLVEAAIRDDAQPPCGAR